MSPLETQIAQLEQTLKKQPKDAALWMRLGGLHRRNNNYLAAINSFTQCVGMDPNASRAWLNIGFCFLDLFKLKEALETFTFVLQIAPREPEAIFGAAVAYESLGNPQQALTLMDQAVALAPQVGQFYTYRAYLRATLSRDPAVTLAAFSEWGERFADPLTAQARPLTPNRDPARKLRIGYVSADLRDHAVAYFVEPIFALHERGNFEVHVFSSGAEDHVTARIRPAVDRWHSVAGINDEALYALIRKQKIDVLIDLSGHSRDNRLLAFARRAAPVQATWLGYMYTTGMRAMDYRITDALLDPPGAAHTGQSETLFRLNLLAPYQPPQDVPLPLELPMQAHGGVTFASLNHLKKVTDEMLRTWHRVLDAVPGSRLLLISAERTAEEALERQSPRLQGLGLPLERIVLLPRMLLSDFMQMGTVADIALDTAPVSGGTTTLHSLWMGLPIICMAGEQGFEGSTSKVMTRLGHADLVARDADEYVAKAVALAQAPGRIAAFRAGIRPCMQQSVLMDYPAFVRDFEAGLRLMWLNYLRGEQACLHTGYDLEQEAAACAALPRAA